jgi:hypothetical protein
MKPGDIWLVEKAAALPITSGGAFARTVMDEVLARVAPIFLIKPPGYLEKELLRLNTLRLVRHS